MPNDRPVLVGQIEFDSAVRYKFSDVIPWAIHIPSFESDELTSPLLTHQITHSHLTICTQEHHDRNQTLPLLLYFASNMHRSLITSTPYLTYHAKAHVGKPC
jgi:hypothetical protein